MKSGKCCIYLSKISQSHACLYTLFEYLYISFLMALHFFICAIWYCSEQLIFVVAFFKHYDCRRIAVLGPLLQHAVAVAVAAATSPAVVAPTCRARFCNLDNALMHLDLICTPRETKKYVQRRFFFCSVAIFVRYSFFFTKNFLHIYSNFFFIKNYLFNYYYYF